MLNKSLKFVSTQEDQTEMELIASQLEYRTSGRTSSNVAKEGVHGTTRQGRTS